MKLSKISSNWHTWIGAVLSIPILIVGITAVYLVHKDFFKGEKEKHEKHEQNEKYSTTKVDMKDIKAVAVDENNITWFGTKKGLYKIKNGKPEAVKALMDIDVRQLFNYEKNLFVVTKEGLYVKAQDKFEKIIEGEFTALSTTPDNLLLLTGKYGILSSRDGGKTFTEDAGFTQLASNLPGVVKMKEKEYKMKDGEKEKEGRDFGKLMKDLHTGKFLGKDYMWIWGDVVGIACVLLVVTGLYMWYKKSRNNRLINKNI
jgi:hypothetical protein